MNETKSRIRRATEINVLVIGNDQSQIFAQEVVDICKEDAQKEINYNISHLDPNVLDTHTLINEEHNLVVVVLEENEGFFDDQRNFLQKIVDSNSEAKRGKRTMIIVTHLPIKSEDNPLRLREMRKKDAYKGVHYLETLKIMDLLFLFNGVPARKKPGIVEKAREVLPQKLTEMAEA